MKSRKLRLSVSTITLLALIGISSFALLFSFNRIGPVYASPSWLTGWGYRRSITVNHALISEDLTNFPVLVNLTSFFDFNKAKSNGEDIRFTGSDGATLLKYEIERWDKVAGKGEVWVKLPSVSSLSDTQFYVYYGNAGASDAQDKTNVWDTNFRMVQHLKEASGTQYDSTSNGNNGSPLNGVIQGTAGKIDGADSFDGTNDYVNCGTQSSLTFIQMTIEAWVKRTGAGIATSCGTGGITNGEPLVAKGRGYSETLGLNVNYFLAVVQSNSTIGFDFENNINGQNYPTVSNAAISDNQWYHVTATYNGTATRIYINGALDKLKVLGQTPDYNPWATAIGSAISGAGVGTPAGYFKGLIDEVRISNTARSAAWVKASYDSESNSLLTYGGEQQGPPISSNLGCNATHAGGPAKFYVKWNDPDGLDKCLFATNNTGGLWQNQTVPVSGTESWANVTLTLTSVPGTVVGYRWYANDTIGNMADTGKQTLTTTGDWAYAKKLWFNNTAAITETLFGFPVMVNLTRAGPDFWNLVGSSYADLRFTDSDGVTDLYFEVEYWNYAEQKAYAWVRVPQINVGTPKSIYLYYGNPYPPPSSYLNSPLVWDTNSKMVHHLKETSGTHYDSTSNDNDGTPNGSLNQNAAGKIDGADAFDGSNDYVNCGNNPSLTVAAMTIETWIKRTGAGDTADTGTGGFTGEPILAKGRAFNESLSWNVNYFLGVRTSDTRIGFDFEDNVYGTNHPIYSASPIINNQWYHVAVTHDLATLKMYINGDLSNSASIPYTPDYNRWAVAIGSSIANVPLPGVTDGFFNGVIDEVRISNIARSAGWVRADYYSGNDNFVTFGMEERSKIPIYTNLCYNNTLAGNPTEFYVKWIDSDGLDKAVFNTNNTGSWLNQTVALSGIESWANVTLTLNAVPGTVIGFRWYANDTLGYETDTGIRTLLTTGNWQYAKKLFFDNTGIPENLVDFPVFINLTRAGADFWSHVGSSYKDLRFIDSDSVTDLYFEVEYWNYSAQKAYVWVKVPRIDSGSFTDFIYVYYGNPSPPELPYNDSSKVWDSTFMMVHHLEETSGLEYDSTSNRNDGTALGSMTQNAAGWIDGADAFDGVNDYVNCGNNPSLTATQFTLEAWIRRIGNGVATTTGTGGFIGEPVIAKGRAYAETIGQNVNYFFGINQTGGRVGFDFEDNNNGLNHPILSNAAILNGQWYYIVATYNATWSKIYINGVLDNSLSVSMTPDYNPWPATIGSAISDEGGVGTAKGFFNGIIDEARISNKARSSTWIKAQNLSMSDRYITFGSEQAPNHVPYKPFNPNPSNWAVGASTSVTLSVNVSDPDGDTMDVYFYNASATPPAPQDFAVIVLPDTQYYSQSYTSIFNSQTQWIADNVGTMNILFVTNEGDIVESYSTIAQWQNANSSMSRLDNHVPYGLSPGNHDGAGADLTNYNTYFGYSRYNGNSWYGGAYLNDNANSYQLFTGGQDEYLILHFQYAPSDAVLAWANATVQSHPSKRVIVTTHDYLTVSAGTRSANGQRIWDKFIKHHADQVFLVLSGHDPGEAFRTDTVNGHVVYQFVADYQSRANGGNGWLRILRFSPAQDKIFVQTYSPYLGNFETDSNSEYTLSFDMTGAVTWEPTLIGVASDIPSGGTASVAWSGLNLDNTYRWYAVAKDTDGATIQSDTWSFTTWTGHDIAVTNIVSPKTVVGEGYPVEINVTVTNQGLFTETFNVTAYADTSIVGKYSDIVLTSGNSIKLTFTWDTAGVAKGSYTLSASATPVLAETDTLDNTYNDGTVAVTTPGDVNADGIVDILDVSGVSAHWYPGPPEGPLGYHPNFDINNDGNIDILEISIISAYWTGPPKGPLAP